MMAKESQKSLLRIKSLQFKRLSLKLRTKNQGEQLRQKGYKALPGPTQGRKMNATAEQVQELGEFCNLQHSALAGWHKEINVKAISPSEDAINCEELWKKVLKKQNNWAAPGPDGSLATGWGPF